MDAARREALLHEVFSLVRSTVPLLVWVSQRSVPGTMDTVELLSRRLKKSKYSGEVFWVDTPLFYQSNRGLPGYYEKMTRQFHTGWVLHNDPGLIKPLRRPIRRQNIRTSILKQLSTLEGMKGLIFSGPLDRAQNYQKAVRSASEFRIYDGEEHRFLNHPSLSGLVSVGANLAPRGWQKITNSSLHLDAGGEEYPDHQRQIFEAGSAISDLMNLYADNPVPLLKEVLFRMGILESPFSYRGAAADPQRVKDLLDTVTAGRGGL